MTWRDLTAGEVASVGMRMGVYELADADGTCSSSVTPAGGRPTGCAASYGDTSMQTNGGRCGFASS